MEERFASGLSSFTATMSSCDQKGMYSRPSGASGILVAKVTSRLPAAKSCSRVELNPWWTFTEVESSKWARKARIMRDQSSFWMEKGTPMRSISTLLFTITCTRWRPVSMFFSASEA